MIQRRWSTRLVKHYVATVAELVEVKLCDKDWMIKMIFNNSKLEP